MSIERATGLLVMLALVGCGGGASAPVGPTASCDVANAGPLVGYQYDLAAANAPTGGALADGVYDLVGIVEHGRASGPWSSNQAPAFRWTMTFTTDTRSPDHAEGRLTSSLNLPPASRCDVGRFATIGHELRTYTQSHPELEAQAYSVNGGDLVLQTEGVTYTFRRR